MLFFLGRDDAEICMAVFAEICTLEKKSIAKNSAPGSADCLLQNIYIFY